MTTKITIELDDQGLDALQRARAMVASSWGRESVTEGEAIGIVLQAYVEQFSPIRDLPSTDVQ